MITGRQIAAARALLGLTAADLARQAELPLATVDEMEASATAYPDDRSEAAALRTALEKAGITFIDERVTSAAGGPGIRLSVPLSTSHDTDASGTVQYPEMAKDGPFGAGG